MSGLDELTREELIELVLKLHKTVQIQQKEIAEILHSVAESGSSAYDDLLGRVSCKDTMKAVCKDRERLGLRLHFESELLELAKPYVKVASAPQRVLAERMEKFIGELFVFVQYPYVPSENNAAERAIRPAVVARKISGGTRSDRGSKTSSILRSLFETWGVQGLNSIDACRQMIIDSNRKPKTAAS